MSAKWRRSLAWDERVIPAWARPARSLLRAFSSIPLAVVLLSLVLVYGVLASVPIGLLALAPTYLIYAVTLIAAVAVWTVPGVALVRRAMVHTARGPRFAAAFVTVILCSALGAWLWLTLLWPVLRYDPASGSGVRFFAGFAETYASTTLRRLPGFEMTEGEFYGWWPLRVILLLFIANMVTATARRIEFRFENLGVLTVHTGIVVLALGSIHYRSLKQEGDVLLLAAAQSGAPGPAETTFVDRTDPALWVSLDGRPWRTAELRGLPRYNDYGAALSDRPLSIEAPSVPGIAPTDAPIDVRIVGFGAYVELVDQWAPAEPGPAGDGAPLVDLTLLSRLDRDADEPPAVAAELRIPAGSPRDRIARLGGALTLEHVPPGDPRWEILDLPIDGEGSWSLALPDGAGGWRAVAVEVGSQVKAGGVTVEVVALHSSTPFPIITPGYDGADSEVAVLRVTTPEGATFERWVFARFPELDQDIHGAKPDGQPDRRPADPALPIYLLPRQTMEVYIQDGQAVVRRAGGSARRLSASAGQAIDLAPMVSLRVDGAWPASERTETPVPVPRADQRKDMVGTHDRAAIAVELTSEGWRKVFWLPYARFMNVSTGADRTVTLPDGRTLRLAFSRAPRPLPGLALSLVDFEMIPYPHSEIPRDYVSKVMVRDRVRDTVTTAVTRLNAPLVHRVPFRRRADRSVVANALGAAAGIIAPNRYTFSQAGWDAEGWRQTSAQTAAGTLDRPRAAFTILAVGNNPGIYVIAAGGVMVCVGIPWAFYIKPWLLRRKRDRLRAQHAAGAGAPPEPARTADAGTLEPVGSAT